VPRPWSRVRAFLASATRLLGRRRRSLALLRRVVRLSLVGLRRAVRLRLAAVPRRRLRADHLVPARCSRCLPVAHRRLGAPCRRPALAAADSAALRRLVDPAVPAERRQPLALAARPAQASAVLLVRALARHLAPVGRRLPASAVRLVRAPRLAGWLLRAPVRRLVACLAVQEVRRWLPVERLHLAAPLLVRADLAVSLHLVDPLLVPADLVVSLRLVDPLLVPVDLVVSLRLVDPRLAQDALRLEVPAVRRWTDRAERRPHSPAAAVRRRLAVRRSLAARRSSTFQSRWRRLRRRS
jgi:hypothetical protein